MPTSDEIEAGARAVVEFILSKAPGKVDWEDGRLYDSDSNWGFEPVELAAAVLRAVERVREEKSADGEEKA